VTGDWVTDGTPFTLADLDSGKTIASVTVKVTAPTPPPPPPPPAALSISNLAIAAALVKDSSGTVNFCTQPPYQAVFRTIDKEAWIWMTTANAHPGDQLAINWIHPSGRIETQTTTLNYTGNGCHAFALEIQGTSAAAEPGNWQVSILTNGTTAFTRPFSIQSSLTVTNKTTAAGPVGTGIGVDFCATPITKTAFRTTDPSVWLLYTIDVARPGDVLVVNWVHPSGRVDATPSTRIDYSGSGCYGWYINIQGDTAASEPGNWQVRLLVNGATAFSLPFTIQR
jgi:hypothetical protein